MVTYLIFFFDKFNAKRASLIAIASSFYISLIERNHILMQIFLKSEMAWIELSEISVSILPYLRGLEYTECVPCSVLCITLNCIRRRGSSSGDMKSMEYLFIVITPRSILIGSGCTC